MRILIAVGGIFVSISVVISCMSQTPITDRAGTTWTCRQDETFSPNPIYTNYDETRAGRRIKVHQYNVTRAENAHEVGHADDHKAICIAPEGDDFIWYAASPMKHVSVRITPVTDHAICRQAGGSNPPFKFGFPSTPPLESLRSGPAAYDYSLCAFEVKYTITTAAADGGDAVIQGDPHIIVGGGSLAEIIKFDRQDIDHLKSLLNNKNYKSQKPKH